MSSPLSTLRTGILGLGAALAVGALQAAPPTAELTADQLVTQVLQANPGVQALEHAVNAARARALPAGALDDPMLSYAVAPRSIGAPGLDTGHIVRLEQPLPWFGKRATRRAAAQAHTNGVAAALQQRQQEAARDARLLYADWFEVHGALRINTARQRTLADLRETAEGLYRAGLGNQTGVVAATLRGEQRAQEALELKARRKALAARINALRNRPVATPLAAPGGLPLPEALPDVATLAGPWERGHPALARLRALEARAQQQVALAQLDYRPDVRLMAQYLGTLPREENRAQVGISLNLPFGHGRRDAALDAARADAEGLAAEWRERRNALRAELAAVYADAQSAIDTLALYRSRMLPLAEQAQRAAQADFAAGRGAARAAIDAEEDLLATQLGSLRAHARLYRLSVRLHWLLGADPMRPLADPLDQAHSP